LRKAGGVRESVRNAWTKRSLIRDARHASRLSEPIMRVGDSHHALDGIAQNFKMRVRNLGIGPAVKRKMVQRASSLLAFDKVGEG